MKKNTSIFGLLAALCLLFQVLSGVLLMLIYDAEVNFLTILSWGICIAYGVVLFLQKKDISLLAASAALAVLCLVNLIMLEAASLYYVMAFLAAAGMAALTAVNVLPALKSYTSLMKVLWFVPGLLVAIAFITMLGDYFESFEALEYLPDSYVIDYVFILLMDFLKVLSFVAFFFFCGMWLNAGVGVEKKTWQPRPYPQQNPYQPYGQQNGYQQPYGQQNGYQQPYGQQNAYQPEPQQGNYAPPAEQPQAEPAVVGELKTYKELLDMGIITQQEYDAKKKQLLGL